MVNDSEEKIRPFFQIVRLGSHGKFIPVFCDIVNKNVLLDNK